MIRLKFRYKSFLLGFGALVLSLSSAAQSIQAELSSLQSHPTAKLGVGSKVRLSFQNRLRDSQGVYLGRLVNHRGNLGPTMFLDETRNQVLLVNRSDLNIFGLRPQLVQQPYQQVGGTCTGYAMNHFLQQLYWSGFRGNGVLGETLSTEKGRTQLLVEAIHEYYLVLQHRFSILGILNKFGRRFESRCRLKEFSDPRLAIQYLENQLEAGLPVMLAYNLGPNMEESPYPVYEYGVRGAKDNRLWVPRRIGERKSGGHAIVAVDTFVADGKKMLLILDSDWSEPRVWEVDKILNHPKVAIREIEFYSCQ